jgi:cysteine-rich repeat protein
MRPLLHSLPLVRSALVALAAAGVASASFAGGTSQPKTYRGSRLITQEANGWCQERGAGTGGLPLEGKSLSLKSASNPKKNSFLYRSGKQQPPLISSPDPSQAGFAVLVRGSGGADDRSALAVLDNDLWKPIGKGTAPKGWKYKDKTGAHGGIREVVLKNGQLSITGKGENWLFAPDGADDAVSVHVQIGNQSYCSTFGGSVQQDSGVYKARNAAAPSECAVQMCGNGIQEVGEICDDGNLDAEDGCGNDCLESVCVGETYASTFEAIQKTVLDPYGCTSSLCHGSHDENGDPDPAGHESGLQLLPVEAGNLPASAPQGLAAILARNHEALLTLTPANNQYYNHFIVTGDAKTSLIYQALYKKVHCFENPNPPAECDDLETTVEAMPASTDEAIRPEQLEAVALWLRAGAPLNGVVRETADKLGACLPPATPGKIDPLPAPPAGEGVQLRSSAWSLPKDSENEICFPTYMDLTTVVPEDQWIDCPTRNGDDVFGPLNTGHKCFRWERQLLLQDPQSHHSIIHMYTGVHDTTDPDWGPWTYKRDDLTDPTNGQACDPLAIDPATGRNDGCSGNPVRSAACLNYGPDDFTTGTFGGNTTAPQFSGSQETHYDQELPETVYSVLPLKGIVVWNSHAFNLTKIDTTMNQYLNFWFADESDSNQTDQIFDADEIFWESGLPVPPNPAVPPFVKQEFCSTFTAPQGAHVFWLSSHTHRHGVEWRTYGPPNTPCTSDQPACVRPADDDRLMYYSTVYNDPFQMEIDPPLLMDGATAAARTFLFCAVYDNGSTPASPSVKRQSTSPDPPTLFGIAIGGPCDDEEKACITTNPAKRGQLCAAQPDPDAFCSSPGIQGYCDACPLRGGFTTEDEMFILLGNYY